MAKGFGGKASLVVILSGVSMAAKNQCGFFTNILYYETLADGKQAQRVIDRYNIGITARQWGRSRKTIRKNLLSAGAYQNDGVNGEKEQFLVYFSSGNFDDLEEQEARQHTLKSCRKCEELHAQPFFLLRKNIPTINHVDNNIQPQAQPQPQPQPPNDDVIPPEDDPPQQNNDQVAPAPQFNTPKKVLQYYLEKTPESITPEDISLVMQTVFKPITDLTHKTAHKEHFYDKFFGKRKLDDPKYLSKKAKTELTKQQHKEMEVENLNVDFNRVFTTTQSTAEWERQRKKDMIYRENRVKQHTGNLQRYRYDEMLLRDTLRAANGDYKTIIWSALARKINLRSPKNVLPKNGGQV